QNRSCPKCWCEKWQRSCNPQRSRRRLADKDRQLSVVGKSLIDPLPLDSTWRAESLRMWYSRAMRTLLTPAAAVLLAYSLHATDPTPETRRWWNHVVALANDGMEGRDTGGEGYLRAARYVVTLFERVGLKPAGDNGYYQTVPLHAVRLRADLSRAELV